MGHQLTVAPDKSAIGYFSTRCTAEPRQYSMPQRFKVIAASVSDCALAFHNNM